MITGTIHTELRFTGQIQLEGSLVGSLSETSNSLVGLLKESNGSLKGSIHLEGGLVGSLSETGCNLVGSLKEPIGYDNYIGPYEVVPRVVEQTLNTIDKHLTNDIVIRKIPYYNVSNPSGGSTVYIGNGVE